MMSGQKHMACALRVGKGVSYRDDASSHQGCNHCHESHKNQVRQFLSLESIYASSKLFTSLRAHLPLWPIIGVLVSKIRNGIEF